MAFEWRPAGVPADDKFGLQIVQSLWKKLWIAFGK
jgi:hypothetical protein